MDSNLSVSNVVDSSKFRYLLQLIKVKFLYHSFCMNQWQCINIFHANVPLYRNQSIDLHWLEGNIGMKKFKNHTKWNVIKNIQFYNCSKENKNREGKAHPNLTKPCKIFCTLSILTKPLFARYPYKKAI